MAQFEVRPRHNRVPINLTSLVSSDSTGNFENSGKFEKAETSRQAVVPCPSALIGMEAGRCWLDQIYDGVLLAGRKADFTE